MNKTLAKKMNKDALVEILANSDEIEYTEEVLKKMNKDALVTLVTITKSTKNTKTVKKVKNMKKSTLKTTLKLYKTNWNKTNKSPLIQLDNIALNNQIIATNYNPNEIKVIFADIKQNKEEIKKLQKLNANSYEKLLPMVIKAINAKKLIYPSLSNKNLLKLIKSDFDTSDKLVNDTFYLKTKNITLPYGVNKNQVAKIVKFNRNKLVSNNMLKNLTLMSVEVLINEVEKQLAEAKKIAIYEEVKKEKEKDFIEVELIA